PFAPSIEWEDHRTVGLGSTRGAEAALRGIRTLFELVEGSAYRVDDILALRSDALVMRWTHSGVDRAGGGAIERQFIALQLFGDDGLIPRNAQFDANGDAEALARFDELVLTPVERLAAKPRAVPRVQRRVRANAATASAARADAAIAARDVDAFLATWVEGAEVIDHPTGAAYGRQ